MLGAGQYGEHDGTRGSGAHPLGEKPSTLDRGVGVVLAVDDEERWRMWSGIGERRGRQLM